MNKVYERINWENDKTPINESNLNRIDRALDEIDDRVVKFSRQKDAIEAATQSANSAATNANTATTAANSSANNANTAATKANAAATNANEAAQAVLDEKYILTAQTEMVRSGTARPTAQGNALLEKLCGASWQENTKDWWILGDINATATGEVFSKVAINIPAGDYILKFEHDNLMLTTVSFEFFDTDGNLCMASEIDLGGSINSEQVFSFMVDIGYVSVSINRTAKLDNIQLLQDLGAPTQNNIQTIHSVGDSVKMIQGIHSADTGLYVNNTTYVTNEYPIPCKKGDVIKIETEKPWWVNIMRYNGKSYLGAMGLNKDFEPFEYTIPDNATEFRVNIGNRTATTEVTPENVGKIMITVNGKYVLQIVSHGKNFFNPHIIQNKFVGSDLVENYNEGYGASKVFPIEEGFTASWKYIGSADDTNYGYIVYYDKNMKVLTRKYRSTNTNSFIAADPSLGSYFRFIYRLNTLVDIQLEHGTEVTLYEEYTDKVTNILLDEPLRTDDCIIFKDGMYVGNRKRAVVVFDGSDDETFILSSNNVFRLTIPSPLAKKVLYPDSAYTYCDQYKCNRNSNANMPDKTFKICKLSDTVNAYLFIKDLDYTTVEEFKARLQANPITVEYELDEETFTPIENQTPFYEIQSFDEVTNIFIAGIHENLESVLTMRFPRHEDGALVTTAYCNSKKAEIRMDELTAAMLAISQS